MDEPKRENPVQAENTGDAPKRAFPEQVKPELVLADIHSSRCEL